MAVDGSSISSAVSWLAALLLGPAAVTIAILAVAAYGFLMLSGRVHWRRGVRVVIGCFILFSAPLIAAGMLGAIGSYETGGAQVTGTEPRAAPPGSDGGYPRTVCWTCGIAPAGPDRE